MKLIVGLGNYPKEYENTHHNIGFIFLDNYILERELSPSKYGFKGNYVKTKINGEDVIFLKPYTYMNLSGESVIEVINYFKIDIDNIFVIYDDMDLPFGEIRLREKGSSGGHNGIKSLIAHLKTEEFKRLRFGIGKNENAVDHVLSKFSKEEEKIVYEKKDIVNDIIDDYLKMDFSRLMSKYNKNG